MEVPDDAEPADVLEQHEDVPEPEQDDLADDDLADDPGARIDDPA